jgi:starch-binding outer membrane protein, SusD/RagB family
MENIIRVGWSNLFAIILLTSCQIFPMRNLTVFATAILLSVFSSCKKDDKITAQSTGEFSGFVQKGPFITGSSVTLFEMSSSLIPTGRVFENEIISPRGNFSIATDSLISKFVTLKANGFYYN